MSAETITIGYDVDNVVDLKNTLDHHLENLFDFVILPLVNPRNERSLIPSPHLSHRDVPLTCSDLVLPANQWGSYVVGKVSSWLDFDSASERVQLNSRLAFKQELAWASHLSLSAVLLPTPDWDCWNFASCVLSTLLNLSGCSLWVEVPLISNKQMMLHSQDVEINDSSVITAQDSPWECWIKMKTLCNHHSSLLVVLTITENLPSEEIINRWIAEPVKALLLPVDIFLTNKKGFPVLSKRHQAVMKLFFGFNVQVIIRGTSRHPKGITIYQQYVSWLWRQVPPLSELLLFEKPYWDYLQSPLQPLMDNLESQTYETFEKDPVKYQKYEDAICEALKNDPFLKGKPEVVLMVLGAGRGPLVFAAMRAAKTSNRKLKLYALEKNQNAINTLYNLRDTNPEWKAHNVTVISSDIRNWKAEELADVVVSELLGSFGDNELSPECLYGAQNLLKEGAISIPCSYTSYLSPLSSHKLYTEVCTFNSPKNFETAYVVKYHAAHILSPSKDFFTFIHPNKDTNCLRYEKRTFNIKHSALLHGFSGYFDATLYGDVHISIHPPTSTPDMFSWFPLYFPLKDPVYVPEGSLLTVNMWRLSDGKKVWYEWSCSVSPTSEASATLVVPVHNPNGRSWWIGL